LKREDARERNQDKKAMAAESEYRVHILPGQNGTFASIKICVTLAVALAAPSERKDNT